MRRLVIESVATGNLLEWLTTATKDMATSEKNRIFDLVAEMHRLQEIDALNSLLKTDAEWDWMPSWINQQHVLKELIPRLEVTVPQMMSAISAINAWNTLYILDEAFLAWCLVDLYRADQVIRISSKGSTVTDRFLLPALLAGMKSGSRDYLGISEEIARGERPVERSIGIRALSIMPFVDDDSTQTAIMTLKSVIGTDGLSVDICSAALSAAIDIIVRTPSNCDEQIIDLIRSLSQDRSPYLLEVCAESFGRYSCEVSESLFEALVYVLPTLGLDRANAFSQIDSGLYRMLCNPVYENRALKLIENLVCREDGESIFQKLNNTQHKLANDDTARFSRVVVRWLMSGEICLHKAVKCLMHKTHGRDVTLTYNISDGKITVCQALFLARKAIEWFFFRPVAAASLIVSLIIEFSDSNSKPLVDLLLDPLLISYPGSVRLYLDSVAHTFSCNTKNIMRKILESHDKYLETLNSVDLPFELCPPEKRRRIEFEKQNDAFSAARRAAEKRSIFHSHISTVMLLHGTSSICYVDDLDGENRKIVNKLGRITAEIEHPMQLTFDSLGLEYRISVFQIEKMRT